MPGTQRGRKNPSQRGDFTGNKKEALARENAEAVEARRAELGLVTVGTQEAKDEGVIDLMGQASPAPDLDDPDLMRSLAAQRQSEEDAPLPRDAAHRAQEAMVHDAVQQPEQPVARKLDGGGKSTMEVYELEPEKPIAAVSSTEALAADTLTKPCEIKVLYDLEDVTIGYGNTYTFREGFRYRVPRWVAAHLEEKQLAFVTNLTPTA